MRGPCSATRSGWPTCSESSSGNVSPSTGCSRFSATTCTTRSLRAGWGCPRATATGIVGAYGGLVYLSTVLGGWIADRVLGMERTVFLRRRRGDARAHRARDRARPDRCRRRAGAGRARLRCAEGQRVVTAGHPVREGRRARRRWLHAVLSRHQPRRVRRSADHRPAPDPRRVSTTASVRRRSAWRRG